MEEPIIICPNCSTEIKLNESLAGPLVAEAKKKYEAQFQVEKENLKKEAEAEAKNKIDADFQVKIKETKELQELLDKNAGKLVEAQKAQTDFLKKQRELDEQKRELDLLVEKKLQASIKEIQTKSRQEAEDSLNMKVAERDTQIQAMKKTIDELSRKSDQGSQQLQGEVLELELEQLLESKFSHDQISPVPKGELGADIIQSVYSPSNTYSGKMLWEMKRTKNWSDIWLSKLRDDQRTASAEIAIIVSQALPKGIETFDQVDGVWITAPRFTIPLAIALRQSLIEVANARSNNVGQETKMELVYGYLTGPKFKHRIEAIVEKFSDMQNDLDRERKSMMRSWAKREAQIDGVISATVGLHGDLQGIAGNAVLEIESLDLPHLEDEKNITNNGEK